MICLMVDVESPLLKKTVSLLIDLQAWIDLSWNTSSGLSTQREKG